MNDLVSIFSPVYNITSRYPGVLERFLDSVSSQTYTNIEVILVDDGSTDNSADICNQWVQRDSRFRLVRHDTNRTINKARETGFRNSKGRFVFNADPDDLLHPQVIEIQHALLTQHPDCQCVIGIGYPFFNDKELDIAPIDKPDYETVDQREILRRILRSGGHALWNRLYRRELLETIDWDVTRYNDFHLTLQICLNGSKFIYLKDITYFWIQRELSTTHTDLKFMSTQKFDDFTMEWNRYVHGKHPELYADFLYRTYNLLVTGFDRLSDEDKKVWRRKLREFYNLTWRDYVKCDAPLHEKVSLWWEMHFPQHKPLLSKLKSLLS